MITFAVRSREDLIDIMARAVAAAACAAFWWGWLTLGLALVVYVAGSARVDASPAVVLTAAALAAATVFAGGVFLTQRLFGTAHTRIFNALSFLVSHGHAIAQGIVALAKAFAVLLGVSAAVVGIVYLYWLGIMTSASLAIETADRIDRLTLGPSLESGIEWVAAFARMYIAAAIVTLGIAAIVLGIPRIFGPRLSGRGTL